MSKIRALFELLSDGKEKTSLDIQEHIITVCSGSRVGDLRKKGCDIRSRFIRRTSKGSMIYGYKMIFYPDDIKWGSA